ncbi:Eukaryotic aspartyl protease family protein, partial [Striga hermonthica]
SREGDGRMPGSRTRPTISARSAGPVVRRLSPEEVKRRREKGLCFKCEEKFTPGHQCKQAFIIEVANSDGEESKVEEEPHQGDEVEVPEEEAEISMHAMAVIRGPRTMRFPAWVKDRRVIVLVDNGSSHNFINADLSQKLKLPTTKIEPFEVRVANGERLQCTESFRKRLIGRRDTRSSSLVLSLRGVRSCVFFPPHSLFFSFPLFSFDSKKNPKIIIITSPQSKERREEKKAMTNKEMKDKIDNLDVQFCGMSEAIDTLGEGFVNTKTTVQDLMKTVNRRFDEMSRNVLARLPPPRQHDHARPHDRERPEGEDRRREEYECEDDYERQSQASNYCERSKVNKPRITLSTFTGSDPDAWLNRAMQYFELNEMDGPDRVRYAAYYLDGEAN